MKHVYIIDLKAYEAALMSEIPWRLPADCWDGVGRLRVDYHTIAMQFTEEELDEFLSWCNDHGAILKVIGVTKAPTSNFPGGQVEGTEELKNLL